MMTKRVIGGVLPVNYNYGRRRLFQSEGENHAAYLATYSSA